MPPFVDSRLKSNKNVEIPQNFDYELSILVIAKKLNISVEELNMFTLNDFIKFVDMYIGNEDQEATQNDIDSFYAL